MKALLLLLLCSLQLAPSIGGHDDVAKSTARALCIGGGAFANQPAAAAADSSTGSDQHNIKLVASITELGKHLAALDGKAQHVLSLWCNQHLHASTPASPTNAPPSASDHAAEGKKKKVKDECSNSGGGSEKEPKLSEESVEAELASIVNLLGNRAARPSGEAQQEAHMLLANLLQQDMVVRTETFGGPVVLLSFLYTHTHTHTHTYICICYICISRFRALSLQHYPLEVCSLLFTLYAEVRRVILVTSCY